MNDMQIQLQIKITLLDCFPTLQCYLSFNRKVLEIALKETLLS